MKIGLVLLSRRTRVSRPLRSSPDQSRAGANRLFKRMRTRYARSHSLEHSKATCFQHVAVFSNHCMRALSSHTMIAFSVCAPAHFLWLHTSQGATGTQLVKVKTLYSKSLIFLLKQFGASIQVHLSFAPNILSLQSTVCWRDRSLVKLGSRKA